MIYKSLKFLPAGDQIIEIELGDEMSFKLNFLAHSLSKAIRDAKIIGFVELITELASIQIVYNPEKISFNDLKREIEVIYLNLGDLDNQELNSRIYYIPVLYFDPWTQKCIEDYSLKNKIEKDYDPDLIVKLNKLKDKKELKRIHSGTDYWVAALGFWPGLCSLIPLDPRCKLTAPKYNPPRLWTPKGSIGLGGSITSIYPDKTPGGYQILGITPSPTYDPSQTLPDFKDNLALIKAGDRIRFIPVEMDEYLDIKKEVKYGKFHHNFSDYQKFSISNYNNWIKNV